MEFDSHDRVGLRASNVDENFEMLGDKVSRWWNTSAVVEVVEDPRGLVEEELIGRIELLKDVLNEPKNENAKKPIHQRNSPNSSPLFKSTHLYQVNPSSLFRHSSIPSISLPTTQIPP